MTSQDKKKVPKPPKIGRESQKSKPKASSVAIDPDFGRKFFNSSIAIVIFLLVLNFFTGWLSYTTMTALCLGPPVTVSKLAGKAYYKPGEYGYGPGPVLFTDYYCTEQDPSRPRTTIK